MTVRRGRLLVLATLLMSLALVEQTTSAQAGQQPPIPRGADGRPDFSGIWQTLSAAEYDLEPHSTRNDAPPGQGVVEGQFIPYRPEALARRTKELRRTRDRRPAHEVLHVGYASRNLLA